jgi:hypothetical protein
MNESNATTPQTEEVQGGITEDQAVAQLLGKWQAEEPKQEEAAATPEPEQAQADAQEPEEATEEPAAVDGDFEFDFAGEKFKFPASLKESVDRIHVKAKELEAGATRKFQEAAESRKANDAEKAAVTQLRKIAEAHADILADHKMVIRRMAQLEQIDINSTDADTLTRLNAEYNQLTAAKSRIEQSYQQSVAQMTEQEATALRARQEHAQKVVAQRVKGWGPEMEKTLAEYAIGRGAPVEALKGISEPWMVEILADAAYGRQMREHKSVLDKRVTPTQPTLKPGASAAQPKAAARADDAMKRLGRSHSVNDAAMALLARSQVRKK